MAKFPAMPFWTDAYLADTIHLTAEQDGYYLRLLMLLWRSPGQRIPNDDAWIAPRLRATSEAMAAIVRPLIKEFCQCDGNWISQARITREHNYVTQRSKKQSDNAKSRWNKEKDSCHGNAPSGNAPTPTPILKKEKEEVASNVPLDALSKKVASKKGTVLPEDWTPSEKHYSDATKLGLSKIQVDRAAEDMRLWARANANRAVARKFDWNAAFSNWLRRNSHGRPSMARQTAAPEFALGGKIEGVV